jgi:hypothetical protein
MGHTGYIRLANEIKNNKKYYWKNLYIYYKNFIKNCAISLNLKGGKKCKTIYKQILPGGPLDHVVADTWELLEYLKIKTNYRWVLDIIDYFSKYFRDMDNPNYNCPVCNQLTLKLKKLKM